MINPTASIQQLYCSQLEEVLWQDMNRTNWAEQKEGVVIWKVGWQKVDEQPLLSLLSERERASIERLHFRIDRKRAIISRALTKWLCSRYLHLPIAMIRLDRSARGKPFLKEHRHRLQFNRSHCEDQLLIAFRFGNAAIGLDLEKVELRFEYLDIADQYFTLAEKESLRCENPEQQFFRIWTRKEALMKGIGKGLSDELFKVDVLHPSRSPANALSTFYFINTFSTDQNHLASIAMADFEEDINFIQWNPNVIP